MTAPEAVLAAPQIPGLAAEQPQWQRWASIAAVYLGGIALWEAEVRVFHVQKFVLPAPSQVLASLANPNLREWSNTGITALEVIAGYLLGVVLGILAALLFITSRA